MRLSDDKITHLTHVILNGLIRKKAVSLLKEEGIVRREIKRVIINEMKLAEDIDESVRRKLQSYSKKIYEGSPEWEVLYRKFFEEESAKKGMR